jgi:hypothetical protein
VNLLTKNQAPLRLIELAHRSVPDGGCTLARTGALALLSGVGIHYVDRDLSARILGLTPQGLIHVCGKLEELRVYQRVDVAGRLRLGGLAPSRRPVLLRVSDHLSGVVANHCPLPLLASLRRWRRLDGCDTLDVQDYVQVEVVDLNGRAGGSV